METAVQGLAGAWDGCKSKLTVSVVFCNLPGFTLIKMPQKGLSHFSSRTVVIQAGICEGVFSKSLA